MCERTHSLSQTDKCTQKITDRKIRKKKKNKNNDTTAAATTTTKTKTEKTMTTTSTTKTEKKNNEYDRTWSGRQTLTTTINSPVQWVGHCFFFVFSPKPTS